MKCRSSESRKDDPGVSKLGCYVNSIADVASTVALGEIAGNIGMIMLQKKLGDRTAIRIS